MSASLGILFKKTIKAKLRLGIALSGMLALSSGAMADDTADNIAKIDEVFAEWDNTRSPGCVAYAFRDGEVILNRPYGMADLEWPIHLATDTVFYMASVSKQFTAAAVALLVLDGKLDLEQDASKYLPELSGVGAVIKIKHLVHHTSGLRDYFTLLSLKGVSYTDAVTNQDVLDLMSAQRGLDFQPGTDYSYSNSGYVMLSVLVERVSGKTLGAFLKERLFEPLGMRNTHFDDDHRRVVPNRSRSFVKSKTGEWLRNPKIINSTGGGNLLSTTTDLQLWDENFYHKKVGGQAFVDLMLKSGTTGITVNQENPNQGYAFGLSVGSEYRGQKVVLHGGAFMGFRTQLMRFPDQHFSSGVLCNAGNTSSTKLSQKIADVYLAGVLAPYEKKAVAAKQQKEELAPYTMSAPHNLYTGSYRSFELNTDMKIHSMNDVLILRAKGLDNAILVPVSKHAFAVQVDGEPVGITMHFHLEGHSNAEFFTLDLGRAKNIRLNKVVD